MIPVRVGGLTTSRFSLELDGVEHDAVLGCLRTPDPPGEQMDQLANAWLHDAELERFTKFPLARRRSSFLFGRLLAKSAIRESGIEDDPRDIRIDSGIFGQPVVRRSGASPRVTLSHTDGLACVVVSDPGVPFGVDVERFTGKTVPSLKHALSRDFEKFTSSMGSLSEEHFAFALWTQKESVGKAMNIGLTSPMSIYDISKFDWPVPGRIQAEFSNFTQFACETCCSKRFALSLAYPKLGALDRHLEDLLPDEEGSSRWA